MRELEGEVKLWGPLDPFFLAVKRVEARFDPAAPGLKLVSGFLFSTPIPPCTDVFFLTDPVPVLALSAVVVVFVEERESNKLSPQLPISANASWPRLNLGGANEYLFFFLAETAGDIENDDMLSPSGGNEAGSSSSPSPSHLERSAVLIPEASNRSVD